MRRILSSIAFSGICCSAALGANDEESLIQREPTPTAASSDKTTLSQEPEEPNLVQRPPFAKTSYKAAVYEVNVDGPEKRVGIVGSDEGFMMDYQQSWIIDSPSPRTSISFYWRTRSDLKFSISDFDTKDFLESLQQEDWEAYKNFLNLNYPERTIVFEQDSLNNRLAPIVLSKRSRQIAYEEPASNGRTFKTREFFVIHKNKVYIFTFSGPKEEIDGRWIDHETMLSGIFSMD